MSIHFSTKFKLHLVFFSFVFKVKEAHYRKHPEWKWCNKEKKKLGRKGERRSSITEELLSEGVDKDMEIATTVSTMRSKSVPANELRGKLAEDEDISALPQARDSLSRLAKVIDARNKY